MEGFLRGKNHDVGLHEFPFIGLPRYPPFLSFPKHVPWSYYTQFEVVVGIGGSVRLGINAGEILDWLLGWLGADLCDDDYLSMPEYVSCRRITAEGVKENAARIRGRIGQEREYGAYDPESAMGIAVARDRVDIAKALVETGEKPMFFPAASPSMVQAMIDLGADANAPVPTTQWVFGRSTPLINAAQQGSAEALRILIEHGANVNAVDFEKNTALFCAVTRDRLRRPRPSCHPDVVKVLLDAGARTDVDVPSWTAPNVKTILGCAILESGCTPVIEHLLAAGADPNTGDALNVAIEAEGWYRGARDYLPIVHELIRSGARVESSHLFTALNPNVRNVGIIRTLLEAGADPNGVELPGKGRTPNQPPLIAAFSFSYTEWHFGGRPRPERANIRQTLGPIVELLLDHGADPRYPGVMAKARTFLDGSPVLEKMERRARE